MFLESNWTWLAERWGNMADLAERVDDLICSFDSAGDTTMDTLSMLIFGWMLFGLVVLCVGKYVYNRFVLNELASGTAVTAKDGHIIHGDSVGVGGGVASGGGSGGGGASGGGTVGKAGPIGKQKILSSASGSSVSGAGGSGATVSGSHGAVNHPPGSGTSATTPSGSYVPPTPPVRKRLTARKTSGALISPARSSRSLHLPTATGADPDAVRWVNEVIVWLYSDPAILDELLAVWVGSLNDFTANSFEEVSRFAT